MNKWQHYYTGTDDWLKKPESILWNIAKTLPEHVTDILNFGCASGRDFIPFQDRYNLHGIDIVPKEQINFICKTDNLDYTCIRTEDFLDQKPNFDLSDVFVYECGTLMYVDLNRHNEFVDYLMSHGCKNICFIDYYFEKHPDGYLNLDLENDKLFIKYEYRKHLQSPQPMAVIMMENTEWIKQ